MNANIRPADGYEISTDAARFDVAGFHAYVSGESYWAAGRSRAVTDAAVANSVVFGVYAPSGVMVEAARVVSDHATFAWIADVFIKGDHQGRGLGTALMKAVVAHPSVAGKQRAVLATHDAHGLYEKFGFAMLDQPEQWMIRRPGEVP